MCCPVCPTSLVCVRRSGGLNELLLSVTKFTFAKTTLLYFQVFCSRNVGTGLALKEVTFCLEQMRVSDFDVSKIRTPLEFPGASDVYQCAQGGGSCKCLDA